MSELHSNRCPLYFVSTSAPGRPAKTMAAIGLDKPRPVQSDGSFLVTKPESVAALLMDHDERFFQPDRKYIRRYLIRPPLGYALLLGSSRCSAAEEPLKCVEKDLQVMGEVLSEGGWEVNTPYRCNAVMRDYEEVMQGLGGRDMKKYSCFMFYFSGHGSPEGMLFQPNGNVVRFKDTIDTVVRLGDLLGKPKILIFDCCRECGDKGSSESNFNSLAEQFESKYHDTIVCYACTKYTPSLGAHENGSIFTQNFAKKLQRFGRELSFVDLLSQAKGETACVAQVRFEMDQQPISHSGLNAQLLLKETALNESDIARAKNTRFHIVLVPLERCRPELKGPVRAGQTITAAAPPSPIPMETSRQEPVMTDYVVTETHTPVTRFTTRDDVVSNIDSLGRGHHVFLCYLPDPASPYGPPDQTRVQRNRNCIARLHHDLTQHGFVVTSDLGLVDLQPLNILEWYVRHIERCDHVILVCSPSFKELFTSSQPQGTVTDPKAIRFLCYSVAIYAECERSLRNRKSKFIPVVLEPEWLDFDRSVPLLFRGSHIYEVFEEQPRVFDYDNTERHFERLVCRMVGINRATINAPRPGAPISFTSSPSSAEEVNRRKYLAQARLPRDGYITVPSSVGQSASEWSTGEQAWTNIPPTERPSHYAASSYHQAAPTVGAGDMNGTVMPPHVVQPGHLRPPQSGHIVSPTVPSLTSGLPSTEGPPPHTQRHYVGTQYTPTPSPPPPPPHHPAPTVTHTPAPPPSDTLLLAPPPRDLLLWLSDQVVQWKFLGRYLGVEEVDIDRITLEHPNNIREQCFQMLKMFVQMQGAEGTCGRLGEALWQSEKNRHLVGRFSSKLSELANE